MMDANHAIQAVVRRTGLSAHVIRVWEKRYGAVKPARTSTNRRLYSEDHIERLELLRDLTLAGHAIGSIAGLPIERLRQLSEALVVKEMPPAPKNPSATGTVAAFQNDCLEAVKALNAPALEHALKRGERKLGAQGLLQRVIGPVACQIGELWREGTITAAHEHFASAVIRLFLGHAARPFAASDGAPVLIAGTPTGQLHELGALLAGATAANLGWRVTYLGPSLPAADFAGAAEQNEARAVALSLVYPEDDSRLEGELLRLRDLLSPAIPILVGGRAMPAYRDALEKANAIPIQDLAQLASALDDLRRIHGKRG